MNKLVNLIKSNWQVVVILLVFALLSAMYFSPALTGYTLRQGDISSWKAAAKELTDYREMFGEEAIWTNSMFGGMPGYLISTYYLNGFTTINAILSLGLPFTMLPISMLFIAMFSFFILGKALRVNNLIAVLGAVAYGFVSYNLLIIEAGHNTKMQAISYLPAVLGSFLMMYRNKNFWFPLALFTFFMGLELRANHIQMTYYFAFVLLFIGAFKLYEAFKEKTIAHFVKRSSLLVVGVIIAVLANFNQFYNTYTYAKHTMRGTPELTINPDGSSKKANQSSGLDRDYIVQWCYGKQETLNLFIPNAKGDSKNLTGEYFDYLRENNPQMFNYCVEQYQKNGGRVFGGYWGDQPFTSGANYLGAIIVFLALMYLIFVHSKLKWALFGVSFLAILLSWGKNLGGSVEEMWLTNFFIDYIPMYSKFRAVSSILTIVNLTFPLMAMLFVHHLYENKEWAQTNIKKLLIGSGSIAGLVLILAIMPNLLDYTSDVEDMAFGQMYQNYAQTRAGINPADAEMELIDFRSSAFQKDAFRTLMFVLAAIVLLFLWVKDKLKFNMVLPALALLSLIDIWSVDKRYLNNDKNPQNKREYLSWEKVTGFENTSPAGQGDQQIYYIESTANPQIEQKAIQRIQEKKKEKGRLTFMDEESIRFSSLNFNTNYRVLNLDNPFNSASVSYFHKSTGGYHAAKMARYQDMIDFYIQKELGMLQTPEKTKVLNMLNTKYYLYQGNLAFQNPHAYGNAWFVNDVQFVKNPDEEILAIEKIDPKQTVVVDEKFKNVITSNSYVKDESASIQLTSYLPNQLIYQSKSSNDQLAVFSEVFYKDGWNAYLDGKAVKHFRGNYILRGLPVPKGEHQIEFKFEPQMVGVGNIIGISAFIVVLLALIFGIMQELRQEENQAA
ncbi:MAG: YfhO family protein [Flavobacteriales bacterium]|nr:YfhO family protein [Flavobacteriales bacterium]